MRLDSVEIKVTLPSAQAGPAVEAFGLGAGGRRWEVSFCEDVARGTAPATPLLDTGVVLRARHKGGAKADTTIKLRPGRRSQLTPYWLEQHETDDWELKVEADWSGDRRVLAAALTADRPGDRIADVRAGRLPLSQLFHDGQQRFLADGSPIRINLDVLTLLPPVTAVRWPEFEVDPKLSVRAERWTVDDLDFLELSIVADPDEAADRQAALHQYVTAHGFQPDPTAETKTRSVVGHLVEAVLRA